MRWRSGLAVLGVLLLPAAAPAQTSGEGRLNQMIPLLERGLPVLGVTHPAITAGRGGGAGGAGGQPAAAPAPPALDQVARETVAYTLADFEYNNYSPASAGRFREYMEAILAAGGSAKSHGFISKVPIFHTDPAAAAARVHEQLNAGHVGIWMQAVESAEEVRQAIAATRFRSRGGNRPDDDLGIAPAYWGMTPDEYRRKADLWPLNPEGELLLFVIIESREGVARAHEIAAVPGVSVVTVGAGTLGGVYSTTNAEGQRVRDQAGFDAAVETILSACKAARVACSYPANNPAEVERLMERGFSVFTMQSRNQAAFDAVEAGRRLAGRPLTP